MNFSFQRNELFVCGLLHVLSVICLWKVKTRAKGNKKKRYKTPLQPPGALPLMGHLRLLQQYQLPHRTLGALADMYGPAFGIHLGANRAFMVSNCKVARECLTINDKVFSSLPKNLMAKVITYSDLSIKIAPYGQYWHDMRKMAMTQLFFVHRLQLCKDIRETEVNSLLEGLYKKCVKGCGSTFVELQGVFWHTAMNIVLKSIVENRIEGANDVKSGKYKKTFVDISRLTGMFFISDAVPILRWLDWVNGCVGEVKNTERIGLYSEKKDGGASVIIRLLEILM